MFFDWHIIPRTTVSKHTQSYDVALLQHRGSEKAGHGGQLTPLKRGAKVRNCRCQSHGNDHTSLTNSTISRGGVKINVCYIIKLDFMTLTPSC